MQSYMNFKRFLNSIIFLIRFCLPFQQIDSARWTRLYPEAHSSLPRKEFFCLSVNSASTSCLNFMCEWVFIVPCCAEQLQKMKAKSGYVFRLATSCSSHSAFRRHNHQLLDTFTKLRKVTISFVVSVRFSLYPHGTFRLSLDESTWKLLFEYFSTICKQNTLLIKIGQEYRVFYTRTNVHFWYYLDLLFVEWEVFQKNVVHKIKIQFHVQYFSPKIVPFVR